MEGIISHESGVPRPAPHILGTESAAPPKELSYLQSKISSTLANRDESGEAHGGDSDAQDKQSVNKAFVVPLSRHLAALRPLLTGRCPRNSGRAAASYYQQRKRIQGMRREREKVYRRLLNFLPNDAWKAQVDNFTSSEPVPRDFAQHTPETRN